MTALINEYGRAWLLDRLEKLNDREQEVIRRRFGLDDPNLEKQTLREIGEVFEIGRARVAQIEAKALRKLHHPTPGWRWTTERTFVDRCLQREFPIARISIMTHRLINRGFMPPFTSVPWGLIANHRDQCIRNHGQTPERLAERGGLSPSEMVAIIEDRPWRDLDLEDAFETLTDLCERMPI